MVEQIRFFRKRSGRIVNFKLQKIADAISKALAEACSATGRALDIKATANALAEKVRESLDDPNSKYYVKEDEVGSRVPRLEHVQDTVVDVISRGHDDIKGYDDVFATLAGRLYADYRSKREEARKLLKVRSEKDSADVTDKSMLLQKREGVLKGWDRGRIVADLMTLHVDEDTAEEIAKEVERVLLKAGLTNVTSDLITELVNNELVNKGLQVKLNNGKGYIVYKDFLEDLLKEKTVENSNITSNNPEAVAFDVASNVFKQYALDNVFSPSVVKAHLTGSIYLHDLGMITRIYCGSHSVEYLKKYGLKGLGNLNTTSKPAKSASVLTGHLNTFIASMQAYYAGALGMGYINIFYAPLLVGMSKKELHQIAQELIFNGSQNAFSRGSQTIFGDDNVHTGVPTYLSNVPAIGPGGTYMFRKDDGTVIPLKEDVCISDAEQEWLLYYEDGDNRVQVLSEVDGKQYFADNVGGKVLTYGDFEQEAMDFCEALLDVWEEGDANGHVFEFPKCDFHVSAETFTDERQYRLFMKACEVSSRNGSVYFVFDRDFVSLASCCFSGDTKVLLGATKLPSLMTFEQAYEKYGKNNRTVKVYDRGTWRRAKVIRLPGENRRMLSIALGCGKNVVVTADHEFPTNHGVKKAYELTPDDGVLLSAEMVPGHKNCVESNKARIHGALAGAFILTGSREGDALVIHTGIEIDGTPLGFDEFLTQGMLVAGYGDGIERVRMDNDGVVIKVTNREIINAVGKLLKRTPDGTFLSDAVYREDYEARFGVLVGMLAASAIPVEMTVEREKRIFEQLESVATTVGTMCYQKSNGDGTVTVDVSPVIIGVSDGSIIKQDDQEYLKVLSVKETIPSEFVYCFTMLDTKDPYFTLPSGIVTHNCRLKVQITDMSLLTHPERLRSSFPRNEPIVIRKNEGLVEVTSMGRLFEETDGLAIEENGFEVKYLENVQIWDRNGWTNLSRVMRHPKTSENHSDSLRAIRTDSGKMLTVTPNHPMIVCRTNMLEECPKCHDGILEKNGITYYGKQLYRCPSCGRHSVGPVIASYPDSEHVVEASELNDRDAFVECQDVHVIKDKHIDSDDAYLLGAYAGDGSMFTGHRVCAISKYSDHETYKKGVEHAQRSCVKHGLSPERIRQYADKFTFPTELCFDTLNVGHEAYSKQLPSDYLYWDEQTFGDVVSGLIDTDGSIHKSEVLISSTSKVMLVQVQMYLSELGIPARMYLHSTEPTINNEINGLEGFTPTHLAYYLSFKNTERVKSLFRLSWKVQKAPLAVLKKDTKWISCERVYKVQDTADKPEKWVYDVTTESHTFVVNGVLQHNCGFQNVTVNLPQCAYRAYHRYEAQEDRSEDKLASLFFEEIDAMMDLCRDAHVQKRKFIETLMVPGGPMWQVAKPSNDGTPYLNLDTSVYIIGMIGLNDALHYLFGKEMHEDDAVYDFALKVASHMFLRTKQYTAELGWAFKLEESPAESAARRLAKADLVYYRDDALKVFKGTEDAAYYTNSIHLAAEAPVNLVERIRKQSAFHSAIESGAIVHAFVGEQAISAGAIAELVRNTFLKTQCAQLVISPEFTYCDDCGGQQRGLKETCDRCGSEHVKGITRVVGYYSVVNFWNKSKRYGELVARHKGQYSVESAD